MLKVLFAGTPFFTLPTLELLSRRHLLVGILTAPSKKQGRKMVLKDSDVYTFAKLLKRNGKLSDDVPILMPEIIDDTVIENVKQLKPEVLVCFAYGKLFLPNFLSIFTKGAVNIHPSLLPKWRGPSPVPASIYAGESESGVSIQTIEKKMDSGDILAQEKFKIERGDTAGGLLAGKVSAISAKLLSDVLDNFDNLLQNAKKQDEKEATYSYLLKKEDGLINWKRSAIEIELQVCAFTPWPGAYTFCNNKKLNIIKAHAYSPEMDDVYANGDTTEGNEKKDETSFGKVVGKNAKMGILVCTGDGLLCITELQWETKKVLFWKDFLNGDRSLLGSTLIS